MNDAVRQVTHAQNIRYDKTAEALYMIDQTLLPGEEKEIRTETLEEMVEAIKALRVRGAPAIGIFAAYSMYALARTIPTAGTREDFLHSLGSFGDALKAARPTAVNLSWAVDLMLETARERLELDGPALLEALYQKAVEIHEDDIAKSAGPFPNTG